MFQHLNIPTLGIPALLLRLKIRLAESPVAYRLARGAFWSLIGGVASRLFTIVATILVARILGKEGYGEVGMVQSTLGMFGVLAGFGLGTTATKYIAELRIANPQRAGRILGLTVLFSLVSAGAMGLICLALSPWLAARTMGHPELAPALIAGALLLFFSAIGGVFSAALSGFEAFRTIAWINVIQSVASPLLAVPLVWKFGVLGAIYAFTLQALLGLVLCGGSIHRECRRFAIHVSLGRPAWQEWRVLWHFSLPAFLGGLMVTPATWVTNLMLVNRPGGYGEMGLFNAANQWRLVVLFLPNLFMAAVLPVLAESYGREDRGNFNWAVALNLRVIWIVALPLTVLVVTMGQPLTALFGRQFRGSADIIAILMVATFLNLVNSVVGAALAGAGRMWVGMWMNFAWAVLLIASAYFFIPLWQGRGLAGAFLLAYLAHTMWVMAYVERLAPAAILRQWPLMMFSTFILVASGVAGILIPQCYGVSALLVLLSAIPLVGLAREGIRRFRPRTSQAIS